MLKSALSPSLMCADLFKMKETIDDFELSGIEYLHIDVMDGTFVPNFCLGTDFCRRIKEKSSIPVDVHLMVTRPFEKLERFPFGEGDVVSVHHESDIVPHTLDAIERIHARGADAFIALNPDTPVDVLDCYTDHIEGVLLMTVYPGFSGRPMVPGSLEKIRRVRDYLDSIGKENVSVEVDGNVNYEKAPLMRKHGADMFVVGTSSVLGPGDLKENIKKMRKLLDEAVK
ncbi:MAG: ribulose-phosphate 3-epimerase [Clostridiales bacterium]|nr:ribulose-phosphate 3-epimerase [Clostridiales bacterium]